jgi:hypothetical protein
MRTWIAAIALCMAATAVAAAEGTGERIKADAKAMGKDAKDAAVSVGKQISTGSKKAYRSTKNKIKSDVNAGHPGNGSNAARNERTQVSKDGRE